MSKDHKYDVSVIFPSMNEGENVKRVLDELYSQFERLKLNGEVIAIDAVSKSPSYDLYKKYVKERKNFTAVKLSEKLLAGSGKTVQYMTGFALAKGKYIVQIDSDGQDNPADLEKFIQMLDKGYDCVVGHKQKRKDKPFYMFTSKIGNGLTRWLTGTKVHDMNCGFKAYRSEVAKSLNLKGRWYRYIPSILASKGYKITEVPIENRKREWGRTNFSFFNRLQAGLFDIVVISIINRYRDVPIYFWGWLALISCFTAFVMFVGSFLFKQDIYKIYTFGISLLMSGIGALSFMFGLFNEFLRDRSRSSLDSMPIAEIIRSDTK